MNGKRRWLFTCLLLPVLVITGCGFLRNAEKIATAPDPVVVGQDAETETESDAAEQKVKEEQQLISELQIPEEPEQDERDATRSKSLTRPRRMPWSLTLRMILGAWYVRRSLR